MNNRILFEDVRAILPSGGVAAKMLVENGTILDVDPAPTARADEVINASGGVLIPGVIDDQVHFREPGATHKEDLHSGSRACAKGGVTTFLEMPNTSPPAVTQQRLEEKLALAASKSVVNYGFYIGATPHNIESLRGARRTPGIKIFIGSSTGDLLVDSQEALERIFAETTLPLTAHCEDETTIRENRQALGEHVALADHSRIRDHRAALVATQRALDLAFRHRHRFHVLHVSTGAEAELLADHRGLITAEACPHHLFFNVEDYARLGSRAQMNPSIKTKEDNQALWQALLDGHIQVIATDHAPHLLEEKNQPYPTSPSGLPAVENCLALMLDQVNRGRCDIHQLVRWMCEAPARVWDIVNKGRIAPGYDADLALIDMNLTQTIHDATQETKCKWSPWDGVALKGWPVRVWVMGQEVFRDGQINDAARGGEARFDHDLGGYWKNDAT